MIELLKNIAALSLWGLLALVGVSFFLVGLYVVLCIIAEMTRRK